MAALLAGHILGLQIRSVRVVNSADIQLYREEVDAWRSKMVTQWKRSPEFKSLKHQLPVVPKIEAANNGSRSVQAQVEEYHA
jgi:hypothetical protein